MNVSNIEFEVLEIGTKGVHLEATLPEKLCSCLCLSFTYSPRFEATFPDTPCILKPEVEWPTVGNPGLYSPSLHSNWLACEAWDCSYPCP